MTTTTLWKHTPSGDTALVVMDLEYIHGDLDDDVVRIEVTTDDPRWVEAVARENEQLAERNSGETGAVFFAASYKCLADLAYDDSDSHSAGLRPYSFGVQDVDGPFWRESVRQVSCDSNEWSMAVHNELHALRSAGLVAA